jgi:4'-phosphopantetheinyl transferase
MDPSGWPLVDHAPSLGPDDVHVWQARLDCDQQAVLQLESLLAPDEKLRADRFHFRRDRRRYVVGRGRLRMLLGEYLLAAPAEISLTTTPLGKPGLVGTQPADLRFNVAHSDDLVLYAFARGREVGVDVERERPDVDWRELAERFFAPEEVAALTALPDTERLSAFYRCWTRKEAYLKALGFGMQVPLDGFAVTIARDAALVHTNHDPEQRNRWELHGLTPGTGFAAAIAVEGKRCRMHGLRTP